MASLTELRHPSATYNVWTIGDLQQAIPEVSFEPGEQGTAECMIGWVSSDTYSNQMMSLRHASALVKVFCCRMEERVSPWVGKPLGR